MSFQFRVLSFGLIPSRVARGAASAFRRAGKILRIAHDDQGHHSIAAPSADRQFDARYLEAESQNPKPETFFDTDFLRKLERLHLIAKRLGEVEDLLTLYAWSALPSTDPTTEPDGARNKRVGHVLKQYGGQGTPLVQAMSLGEIAMVRQSGLWATESATADVLDLVHRLPLTWADPSPKSVPSGFN